MALPSFLQRKPKGDAPRGTSRKQAAPATDDTGPVQAARTRARRRLVGAVVLLAAGIIGFPLVFDTAPRPVSMDVRIETAAAGTAAAPKPPAAPAAAPVVPDLRQPTAQTNPPPAAPATAQPATEPAVAAEMPSTSRPEAPEPSPATAAAAPPPPIGEPATPPDLPPTAKAPDDGAKARALLEGGAASDAKAARFIVQVGAYTDAVALREARQRVERMGLKTYTQVIDTEAGKRTRVRVGPFASREEADRTSARLKSAGLPVAILAL